MDYAQQQRNPGRHALGIAVVVAMHLLLGWALVSGLGRRVVDVVTPPIETRLIEEPAAPPPPAPVRLPPAAAAPTPPPPLLPPPEIMIERPPPAPAPAITAPPPPPAPAPPPAEAPAAPAQPAPAAPPAPAAAPVRVPGRIDLAGACRPDYPPAARRAQVEGETTIQYEMDTNGRITAARVTKSAGFSREHRALDAASLAAVQNCAGTPASVDGVKQPWSGTVVYTWRIEN